MPINIRRYISSDVGSTSISSLFRFSSSDLKQKEYKGEILCLITLVQSKDFLADKAIKFVWDSIRDTYLMSDSGSIVEDVKKSIASGKKKIIELVKNDKEMESKGVDLSFCLVIIKGMNAYLGIFGEEELFLFKNKSFVNVGQILSENKASAASMALADDDIVLMGTKTTVSNYVKDNDGEAIVRTFSNYGEQIGMNEAIVALSRHDVFRVFEEEVVVAKQQRIHQLHHLNESINTQEIEEDIVPSAPPEPIDSSSGNEMGAEDSHVKANVEKLDVQTKSEYNQEIHKHEREKIVEEYVQEIKERKLEKKAGDMKQNITHIYSKFLSYVKIVNDKLQPLIAKLSPLFRRLVEYVSNIFNKAFSKSRNFLEDSYGRKLWYRRFMAKVSTFKIASGSTSYGMKVDNYKLGQLRKKRIIIVSLIAVSVILVVFGTRLSLDAKKSREIHSEAVLVLNSAQENIAQIEKNITFDKTSAGTFVEDATLDLDKLKDKKLNITDGNKYNQLRSKLQDLKDQLYIVTPVTEANNKVELFYDAKAQIDSKSSPQDIVIYKNEFQEEYIYITDPGTKAVYRIRLNDKELIRVADKTNEVDSPIYIDVGVKGIYVYDSVEGIIESPFDTNGNNKNFIKLSGLDKESLDIKDVKDLSILTQTESVYLLSPSDQAVYKSTRSGNGYGLVSEYIKSNKLENAQDIFADLSIYAISSDSTGLNRFKYNYNTAKFGFSKSSVVGLNPPLTNAVAGYTGGTVENSLYIFDKLNQRLVVLEKPKEAANDMLHPNEFWLVKQIVYRGNRADAWNDIKDIVVDSQEEYAYILDGSRIWKVNLK